MKKEAQEERKQTAAAAKVKNPLRQFSHGGGCGCKIPPAMLAALLAPMKGAAKIAAKKNKKNLLVGFDSADDAAVYLLDKTTALVASADFFAPIVDAPGDFGRIAAANAISDIYAMGATPLFALALLCAPRDMPAEISAAILQGGEDTCAQAGVAVGGGHSIHGAEPLYGMAVIGKAAPENIKTNAAARIGDVLILGKPLGVGILSAAARQEGKLGMRGYQELVRYAAQINAVGAELAKQKKIGAMTDITGFGLAGHLLEICRASNCGATIYFGKLPLIKRAVSLAKSGIQTGASARNWQSYGDDIDCEFTTQTYGGKIHPEWRRIILSDPQTNGGLLVSCPPSAASKTLSLFAAAGFENAAIIGEIRPPDKKAPRLRVCA